MYIFAQYTNGICLLTKWNMRIKIIVWKQNFYISFVILICSINRSSILGLKICSFRVIHKVFKSFILNTNFYKPFCGYIINFFTFYVFYLACIVDNGSKNSFFSSSNISLTWIVFFGIKIFIVVFGHTWIAWLI